MPSAFRRRRKTRPVRPEGAGLAEATPRLEFEPGQTVLEVGYDAEDCAEELHARIEAVIGIDLVDKDYEEGVDAVLLWWREDDGDLVEKLSDVLVDLAEGGRIWLLTPKPGREGHVEPIEIEEAAVATGLAHADSLSVTWNWVGTWLEAADGGVGGGQATNTPTVASDLSTLRTLDWHS